MSVIYMVTSPSGKRYVGITTKTLARRKSVHLSAAKRGGKNIFYNAIRKYGDALKWSVVAEGEFDREFLAMAEQEAIKHYKTKHPDGYNMTDGGEGTHGLSPSQHQKDTARLFMTGRHVSQHTRDLHRNSERAKAFDAVEMNKLRSLKGRKLTEAHIEKLRIANATRERAPLSEQARAKIGAAVRAANARKRAAGITIVSEETRKKMVATRLAKKLSVSHVDLGGEDSK